MLSTLVTLTFQFLALFVLGQKARREKQKPLWVEKMRFKNGFP